MKRTYDVVLASASPRRKELLEQIGILPKIRPSQIEEIITSDIPQQVVMELSLQKARDVANACEPHTLIIGADTVVAFENKILGKPRDHAQAIRMIQEIQGRCHQVYTGVTLIYKGRGEAESQKTFFDQTCVWVYPMSAEEIGAYAATGEPMDKAGAYGIQGSFAAYIEKIDGNYNNVVGLPIGRIYQEIKRLEPKVETRLKWEGGSKDDE